MTDADETIKVLMAGFRDAEPPTGMQSRILEALDLHATGSPGLPKSWRWRPSVGVAFVCAAVLTAALGVAIRIYQPWRGSANTTSPVTHAGARQGARPATTAVKTAAGLRRKASRGTATRRPRESELAAAGETQLASYPAPALPLTEQERLLLRVAHLHDVQSVAILNPGLQAASSAEAAKQFQQFFGIDAKEMRNESE
jgi:hypothetical protein